MGLLFAFFLIGLPLVAGVVDYMMTTGQYKNADLKSKIGGYTPQFSSKSSPMGSDAQAPAVHPAPVTASTAPMHEPPPAL